MKGIVLAAGLGTRLRPLTETTPKALLDVGGESLLARQLRLLRDAGVTRVAVNLHHLSEQIVDRIGDGSALGISIVYSHEKELRGSAGALHGFPGFFDERFFVVYGDVYHEIDLSRLGSFHEEKNALLTMSVHTAEDPTQKGVVQTSQDGRVRSFVEKPPSAPPDARVNAGVYVCEPAVLRAIPPGVSDFGANVIPALIEAGERVYALFTSAIVVDIGTLEGYERARTLAAGRR